ncbi:BZIP transcription factor [Cinnamomum micranthum f. kanehirae]|uniref:BZIP transcription factor n=1 Tax=Cinnamomum micranthum f. kanehirae TaxID=337451 RepID=A0A3S4NZV7_9MAGN|nr:BZIP transcription factor [Cinnamomum micranthum f. kanehirae]
MMEDDCANNVILVHNVMASILSKMIEWCKKHAQMKEDNNNEEKEKELRVFKSILLLDMEKERSTGLGHGRMLSPSARFSGFSSVRSSFGGRGETSRSVAPAPMLAMPELGRFRQEFSFGPGQVSHDHSKMTDVPHMNGGHRRAQSDLPCLPNKVRFGSSPNAVGAFSGPELSEENVNENG